MLWIFLRVCVFSEISSGTMKPAAVIILLLCIRVNNLQDEFG